MGLGLIILSLRPPLALFRISSVWGMLGGPAAHLPFVAARQHPGLPISIGTPAERERYVDARRRVRGRAASAPRCAVCRLVASFDVRRRLSWWEQPQHCQPSCCIFSIPCHSSVLWVCCSSRRAAVEGEVACHGRCSLPIARVRPLRLCFLLSSRRDLTSAGSMADLDRHAELPRRPTRRTSKLSR